jgi:hypothetical protein
MSVNAGHAKLRRASKDLLVRWQGARAAWRDENSRRLDEILVQPLLSNLRTAEIAMEHMEVVLNRIRRDCV